MLMIISWGVLPYRAVSQKTTDDWKALAAIFERLLGGSPTTQRAAAYLRALADCRLPADQPPALPWHDSGAVVEVMPQPRMEPHPVVLATLCPSVALRAVWRRGRWIMARCCFLQRSIEKYPKVVFKPIWSVPNLQMAMPRCREKVAVKR